MVRNVQGGSKTKSQARKSSSTITHRTPLRLSSHPLEVYACVTKMYGHGNCLVHTVCDKELRCIIRNKFKGRSKRHNNIVTGTILLVGLREWESVDNYKTCDVLEIYDNEDHIQLKSIPSTKVQQLEKYVTTFHNDRDKGDDILFTDEENTEEYTVKKQRSVYIFIVVFVFVFFIYIFFFYVCSNFE